MSITRLKALIWICALGAGGYLIYDVWDFLQRKPELEKPVSKEEQIAVLESVPDVKPPREDVIAYPKVKRTWHELNWTGVLPPAPPPEKSDEDETPKIPQKPVAELLAVLLVQVDGGEPALSMATVRFLDPTLQGATKGRLDDAILTEGEKLAAPYDYITVSAIRPDGVHFSFSGDEERPEEIVPTLEYVGHTQIVAVDADGVLAPVRPTIPTAAALDRPRSLPRETALIGKDHYLVGLNDRERLQTDYTKILAEISYRKHRDKSGKVDGIELTDVPEGSFAASYGAKAGQVIKSINGHPVTSVNEAINYAKQNADKYDVWTIVYEEQGKEHTKIIDTSE